MRASDERPGLLGRIVAIGVTGLASLAASGVFGSSGAAVPVDSMEELVRQRLSENRTPGAIVIVRERGETVWTHGFGHDELGNPIGPETLFAVGSISKGVAGLVVASLVDEGRLDLDTPVEQIVPELRDGSTPRAQSEISVGDLVYHRSGLDVRGERLFVDDPPIERARSVWRRPLVRSPGKAFEYLNTNYLILGLIVERVTGRPYREVAHQRVFAPIGRATPADADAVRAGAHQLWFGFPVRNESPPVESPASGGLSMSGEALANLIEALEREGRVGPRSVLDADVVRLATSPGAPIGSDAGYAMGWYRRPIAGVPTLSHGGSTPGYSGFALHQIGRERTIVVLTNSWGAIWGSQTPAWIAADLLRLLEGETVPERRGARFSYLWFDLVVLLGLAFTTRSLLKLPGRRREYSVLATARDRARKAVPVVAWNLGWVVILVWLVPIWFRFSFRSFLAVPSDVGVLLLFGVITSLLTAVWEIAALFPSPGAE